MQERHKNRKNYFYEQGKTTEQYVIPYIESNLKIDEHVRVLEIGCGEGGNITPFLKRGCEVVGVDLHTKQLERAGEYLAEEIPNNKCTLINRDIYKVGVEEVGRFELIIMRDVIEHIHDQKKFLGYLKKFLAPQGRIFFGFPPWRMPFGGHQQICHNKFLSKLPFFHILPTPIYRGILKLFKEPKSVVDSLIEIKETGISISRFTRILKGENYSFEKIDHYFINPNYETKFGLTPRKLTGLISSIPYIKDFFTTCIYALVLFNSTKSNN